MFKNLQDLSNEITNARREHNNEKRDVLLLVKNDADAKIKNEKKDDLNGEEIIKILENNIKQLNATLDFAIKGNRDLSEIQYRIETLTSYLPEKITEDQLKAFIDGLEQQSNIKDYLNKLDEKYAGLYEKKQAVQYIKTKI